MNNTKKNPDFLEKAREKSKMKHLKNSIYTLF